MSFSRFMIACALHGAEADDDEGPRLILSEDEQRQLYERVALLDRCNEALLSRLPGKEISALGALAFRPRVMLATTACVCSCGSRLRLARCRMVAAAMPSTSTLGLRPVSGS